MTLFKPGLFILCLAAALWAGQPSTRTGIDKPKAEQTVTMEQLPPAVAATLKREAGNGKVGEIEQTTSKGKDLFEAEVMLDGKKWEITIRPDGQLLKKELDEEDDDEDDEGEDD
jgi:hypothetical protein